MKIKKKKICDYCGKIYYRNLKFSETQWLNARFCSRQCSANKKRKYANNKIKNEAWRRKIGMVIKGTPEFREKVAKYTKLAMYRPEIQEKIRKNKPAHTFQWKINMSNKMAGKMPANLGMSFKNSAYLNIKRGTYNINGKEIFFRSKWEANYALYLDFLLKQKQIKKWEFEPDTFVFYKIQFGTRSYTPDFKITNNDNSFIYHEIKGYMDSKSLTKLKRMAKYYPEINVNLIEKDEYYTIKSQVGKMLKFY